MESRALLALVVTIGAAAALPGCGGSGTTGAPSSSQAVAGGSSGPAETTTAPADAGALQAEANSAATGDIPDNQVFLSFRAAGWSMKYPEGWAQRGPRNRVTFRDKNNIVRVVVIAASPSTPASIRAEFASSKGVRVLAGPATIRLNGSQAFKIVYTTVSQPNPVTGKRVTLQVDRYYLSHAGKEAIVDLGTPKGVDNVDAYRLMIESFRWR